MNWNTMKIACVFMAAALLSGCAQITYDIAITGDGNSITCTGAVDKTTDDLMDMSGSAYGNAATNGERRDQ